MYLAMGNTDIAHTIGNITFIMTEIIKDWFEPNFFKYTHIGTRIAYREFMKQEMMIRRGILKKDKPILVVRPKPVMFDDDIFMARSNFTSPVFNTEFNMDRSNFQYIFRDNENDITLSYLMNRIRIQCQVSMLFDTEIQQINVYNEIRNRYISDRPYWKKTTSEVFIPKGIIDQIAILAKKDVHDPETDSVRHFINYLMSNSRYYFTYKTKGGNQKEEFFLYYPMTMEMIFTDFDMSDTNKVGSVSDYAGINFTFTTEFNTVGMFQLSTERDDLKLQANTQITMENSAGTVIRPIYTIDKIFNEVDEHGWKLFFTNIFFTDPDVPREKPDIIDLDYIFKDSDVKDIVKYHKSNGISNDILFNFIITKNAQILNGKSDKGKLDYKVDFEEQKILIYNENSSATYRLLVYVNNLYVMQLHQRLETDERYYEKARIKNEDQEVKTPPKINPRDLQKTD